MLKIKLFPCIKSQKIFMVSSLCLSVNLNENDFANLWNGATVC